MIKLTNNRFLRLLDTLKIERENNVRYVFTASLKVADDTFSLGVVVIKESDHNHVKVIDLKLNDSMSLEVTDSQQNKIILKIIEIVD